MAIEENDPQTVVGRLESVDLEWQGFAYEGAAMAFVLLDYLTPWRKNRWRSFVNGAGAKHIYMVHVGAGWAFARLPLNIKRAMVKLDPLLCWLAIDGYGFHDGFFHWSRYITNQEPPPKKLSGYACHAFDQGLGRGLWFIKGIDVEEIAKTISSFAEERRPYLWSGVGLACAYAGGVSTEQLVELGNKSENYRLCLLQGIAFATKARQRAGNMVQQTELACKVLGNISAEKAAEITDTTLKDLPLDGDQPAYEIWRIRIQNELSLLGS